MSQVSPLILAVDTSDSPIWLHGWLQAEHTLRSLLSMGHRADSHVP